MLRTPQTGYTATVWNVLVYNHPLQDTNPNFPRLFLLLPLDPMLLYIYYNCRNSKFATMFGSHIQRHSLYSSL